MNTRVLSLVAVLLGMLLPGQGRAESMQGVKLVFKLGIHKDLVDGKKFYFTTGQSLLADATKRLKRETKGHFGCLDYTACLELATAPTYVTFTNAVEENDPAFFTTTEADNWLEEVVLNDGAPMFRVHRTIRINGDYYAGYALSDETFQGMAAVWTGPTEGADYLVKGSTWAHEFGHMCGLAHFEGLNCTGYNLMTEESPQERDQLWEDQRDIIVAALDYATTTLIQYATAQSIDCDPGAAALLSGLTATPAGLGVAIRFSTVWEHNTESFEVFRMDPSGSGDAVSVGTPTLSVENGERVYRLTDPGGIEGLTYQIVEHQTGGAIDLTAGTVLAEASPTPIPEQGLYDSDSLAAIVAGFDDPIIETLPDPCLSNSNSPGYAILCPDSFVAVLGSYASLWRTRGENVKIIPESFVDSCFGGYRSYIQWAAAKSTRYVLLVGDANDYTMWDNPARWVNGWDYPDGVPASQPGNNVIRTFYEAVVDSPQTAWTFYTPYYATDLPYADVDDDGLPDVIVGRLPASTIAEVQAYTAKLATWLSATNGAYTSTATVVTSAANLMRIPAWPNAFEADTLLNLFPATTTTSRADLISFRWPTAAFTYAEFDSIRTLVNAAASGGADVITWNINQADRYSNALFWSIHSNSDPIPITPTTRPFISLGLSCGMNNFDQTEEERSIPGGSTERVRPLVERLLLDPSRGAIAQIAPTRGSQIDGNSLFGEEFIRRAYEPGATIGRAFLLAQRACIQNHPQYRDLFKSYTLLGDPRLGPTTITGVTAEKSEAPRVTPGLVAARPNPFNPITTLGVRLAIAGRAELRVHDIQGRIVRTLLRGELLPAGVTAVKWDGKNERGTPVASGLYIAKLNAAGSSFMQKLVLLK